jgi:hypothetical protein
MIESQREVANIEQESSKMAIDEVWIRMIEEEVCATVIDAYEQEVEREALEEVVMDLLEEQTGQMVADLSDKIIEEGKDKERDEKEAIQAEKRAKDKAE